MFQKLMILNQISQWHYLMWPSRRQFLHTMLLFFRLKCKLHNHCLILKYNLITQENSVFMFNWYLLKERTCACVLMSISGVTLTSAVCQSQTSYITDWNNGRKKYLPEPMPLQNQVLSQQVKKLVQNTVKFSGEKELYFLIFFVTYCLTCFYPLSCSPDFK